MHLPSSGVPDKAGVLTFIISFLPWNHDGCVDGQQSAGEREGKPVGLSGRRYEHEDCPGKENQCCPDFHPYEAAQTQGGVLDFRGHKASGKQYERACGVEIASPLGGHVEKGEECGCHDGEEPGSDHYVGG